MAYKPDKMTLPALRMLFEVLNEIYITCESRNNAFIMLDKTNDNRTISRNDFVHIIGTLYRDGYVIRHNIISMIFNKLALTITEKFEPFYHQVAERIKQLENNPVKATIEEENNSVIELSFDKENSIFCFGEQKIKISRQRIRKVQHNLMEYVFIDNADDLQQDFSYGFFAEEKLSVIDYAERKHDLWRTYYNAVLSINEKIRKGTNEKIDDFFLCTPSPDGEIKINPKYLLDKP